MHANLCGPMHIKSFGGSKYFLLFIDYYSRMNRVYFLKYKSKAFKLFKKFKVFVKKQSGADIKLLRTNRGGEFLSNKFNLFCKENLFIRSLCHLIHQN